jgi:hypothetical protein
VDKMMFFADEKSGGPRFRTDGTYSALGEWLLSDISASFLICLDALAMADDVLHGRDPFEEWSSDNFEVTFTPETFSARNLWTGTPAGVYPMAYVRDTLEDYWTFLVGRPRRALVREYRPDLPEWHADLLLWEQTWHLTHPYRGRLF